MRRSKWVVVLGVLGVIALVVIAYAAQQSAEPGTMKPPGMMGQEGMMGRPGMMGHGMGGAGPCPMHGGMMHGMMGRSAMVVGGKYLYVLAGDKIMKYDHDLNLVRETEMKTDTAKMSQMMEQCLEKCPMRKQMMPPGK